MAVAQSVIPQTPKRHSALSLMANPKGIWNFLRAADAPRSAKAAAVLAALYVVMPADFIPDLAPIVGWLDDVGMVGIALAFIARQAAQYNVEHDAPTRVQARVTNAP